MQRSGPVANRALRELDGVHYAKMVALGWHSRRGLLVLTNAGHPPPFVFHAARGEWSCLDAREAREPVRRPVGVPLGLLAGVDYKRTVVKPRAGDLVLLYSDGVSEARNPAGDELGRDGLVSLVRSIDPRPALFTSLAPASAETAPPYSIRRLCSIE